MSRKKQIPVCVLFDADLHRKTVQKAKSQDSTISRYLRELARKDLATQVQSIEKPKAA